MTTIESFVTIPKTTKDVYHFLEDFNNHKALMPENIYNWTSDKDMAQFTIQNMAKLSLKITSRVEGQEIIAIPAEKAPFDLELKWIVAAQGDETKVSFVISADLNMMMKMLVAPPLQKLADFQMQKLKEVLL